MAFTGESRGSHGMVELVPKDGILACPSPLIFPRFELSAHNMLVMAMWPLRQPSPSKRSWGS